MEMAPDMGLTGPSGCTMGLHIPRAWGWGDGKAELRGMVQAAPTEKREVMCGWCRGNLKGGKVENIV